MPRRIYYVVLYVLLCCSVLQRAGGGQIKVRSVYVCEKENVRLRCPPPTVLEIYQAMFGRTEPGTSICPHATNITSTSCKAKDSKKIVMSLCASKDKCNVLADSSVFGGDPCPGNFKYLDIIYGCVAPTTTTNPSSPTRQSKIRKTNKTTASNVTSRPESMTKPSTRGRGGQPDATVITTGMTTTAPQGVPKMGFSGPRGEQSITVTLLVSFVLCYKVIQEKPRYTIVIFLSVVAAVTITLLVVLTAVHICKRQNEKRKFQVEIEDQSQKDSERTPQPKTVTIEIQGSREDTREIHVSPGDIIIIDHNGLNSAGSEDLGYLSEIVRYYNGHSTTGSDDQSSLRKRSLTFGTPSVISTETSEIDKKADGKADQPEVNGDCVQSPSMDITVNPLCES